MTLAKELGIYQWLPSAEYREQCRKRERAREAARRLSAAVHSRRMDLLDLLHDLNRLEALGHDAGPTEAGWESLVVVCRERPEIERELDVLETAPTVELVEHFHRRGGSENSAFTLSTKLST